jgi:hypothetical protein
MLLSSSANAVTPEEDAVKYALLSCMYIFGYQGIVEERTPEEMQRVVAKECVNDIDKVNKIIPTKPTEYIKTTSDIYMHMFLDVYKYALTKHKQMYQRR